MTKKKKIENQKLPVVIQTQPKINKVEDSTPKIDNHVVLEYIPNSPRRKKPQRLTIETGEFIYNFFN